MTPFSTLTPPDTTLEMLMRLMHGYENALEQEKAAYKERTQLRIDLLKVFAQTHHLPLSKKAARECLLYGKREVIESCLADWPEETLTPNPQTVTLFNGGPASGKSRFTRMQEWPENLITLDRDSYFEKLPPYSELQQTHPEDAVHTVVCEAILYNERDAYRYALTCGTPHLLVDGTLSYVDIGCSMIDEAQEAGYRVRVINLDCSIETALERARKRAAETGKTINEKLLYESHVRCVKHFLHQYRTLADVAESYKTDTAEEPLLIATKEEEKDKAAFRTLHEKASLPLDAPSWPERFEEYLKKT